MRHKYFPVSKTSDKTIVFWTEWSLFPAKVHVNGYMWIVLIWEVSLRPGTCLNIQVPRQLWLIACIWGWSLCFPLLNDRWGQCSIGTSHIYTWFYGLLNTCMAIFPTIIRIWQVKERKNHHAHLINNETKPPREWDIWINVYNRVTVEHPNPAS